jgi:hypothetical protein
MERIKLLDKAKRYMNKHDLTRREFAERAGFSVRRFLSLNSNKLSKRLSAEEIKFFEDFFEKEKFK